MQTRFLTNQNNFIRCPTRQQLRDNISVNDKKKDFKKDFKKCQDKIARTCRRTNGRRNLLIFKNSFSILVTLFIYKLRNIFACECIACHTLHIYQIISYVLSIFT